MIFFFKQKSNFKVEILHLKPITSYKHVFVWFYKQVQTDIQIDPDTHTGRDAHTYTGKQAENILLGMLINLYNRPEDVTSVYSDIFDKFCSCHMPMNTVSREYLLRVKELRTSSLVPFD